MDTSPAHNRADALGAYTDIRAINSVKSEWDKEMLTTVTKETRLLIKMLI